MSARDAMIGAGVPAAALDAYRGEVLREAAAKIWESGRSSPSAVHEWAQRCSRLIDPDKP